MRSVHSFLRIFVFVPYLTRNKGLSSLIFSKSQPLVNTVPLSQRPDIAKLFTHPWSVNIGKRAIFAIKLVSFYQKWSDQHKFCIKSKGQTSTLILTFKISIALTKILLNLTFSARTSSIFTT